LAHQRPFAHQGAAHAARDRGRYVGMAALDARRLHRRLGLLELGLGQLEPDFGVDQLLLADGLLGRQRAVALQHRPRLAELGFGPALLGAGAG